MSFHCRHKVGNHKILSPWTDIEDVGYVLTPSSNSPTFLVPGTEFLNELEFKNTISRHGSWNCFWYYMLDGLGAGDSHRLRHSPPVWTCWARAGIRTRQENNRKCNLGTVTAVRQGGMQGNVWSLKPLHAKRSEVSCLRMLVNSLDTFPRHCTPLNLPTGWEGQKAHLKTF